MTRQAVLRSAAQAASAVAAAGKAPSKYTPKVGSIAYQVCRFLQANPDEELTRADVAVKWGVPGSAVDGELDYAVTMGMLTKGKNSATEQVWMAGPHIARVVIEPWPEDPELRRAAPLPTTSEGPGLSLPQIRRNTPLLTSEAAKRKAERARVELEWDNWLGQFNPHDSAVFAADKVKEFRQHARRYSRENKTKFRIKDMGGGKFGIERLR